MALEATVRVRIESMSPGNRRALLAGRSGSASLSIKACSPDGLSTGSAISIWGSFSLPSRNILRRESPQYQGANHLHKRTKKLQAPLQRS
jgi:hypothetical protein